MSKRNPLSRILGLICISALLSPGLAVAQQTAVTTKKLRDQIALMEKIDQDEGTSDEVRALNRTLLDERKSQLAARLVKELDGLKKYSQTMEGSLSEGETQKISSLLEGLQRELDGLKQGNNSIRDMAARTNVSTSAPARTTGSTASTNLAPPANEASRNTSNHALRSTSNTAPLLVAACFPDAPDELVRTAKTAAVAFVDNRDTTGLFGDLMFFTVSHTVAIDANREDLLKALEIKQLQEQTRRTDKQVGPPASAAGTTTLAEKPGFAEILGFAIEHGAIQKAVSGTTLNLSTTPYAFTTLNGGDTHSNYKKYGYLTRLGISADFNIQNQDNPLASARRSQLADWSVRLRLSKDRSTRSDDVEAIWHDISAEFARPSIVITDMLRSTFQSDVELETQRRLIVDRLIGVTAQPSLVAIRVNNALTRDQKIDQVAEKFICQAKTDIVDGVRSGSFKISEDSKDRIIRVTLPAYEQARTAKAAALKIFDERIEALSYKPIFTLAYNDVRPTSGINYSELKMLYQKKTGEPISLIANAGLSLYHKPNTVLRQQTVRDFAATLSFEGTMGRSPFMLESMDESQITYSFSGRYQRIFENRFVPGRKADIAFAQFKFNLPMFSGMAFPFSVTYANASELIKEKHVRTNFGFSFDTDKLLKALALAKLANP